MSTSMQKARENIHASHLQVAEIPPNVEAHLAGRIRNGKKLLSGAAIIIELLSDREQRRNDDC